MNKIYLCLLLVGGFVVNLLGQDYATIQKALNAEKNLKYCKAVKYYKEALQDDVNNEYVHYKIGKNYFNQNDYESSIYHMEKANKLMKDSMNYHFDMYHLYSVTGYSALAKESFIRYINLCPTCVKSDLLPGGQSNKFLYSKPIKDPELMGYESGKSEYYSYIMDDNKIQTLNSKKPCKSNISPLNFRENLSSNYSCSDFMFFDVKQNKQPDRAGGHKYGPFTLSKNKENLIVTRLDKSKNRMFIYHSKRENTSDNNDFVSFKPLEIEIDKGGYDYIHPMLTSDEKHLIFSSNQPGGLGGYDLWIGEIENETKLKNIKNLGTYVNTPGDECFPSVYDDRVIFFASNGHYGLGNLDIYAGVKGKGARFNRTYNLGANFNSESDDYALFYHQKKNIGYFTSNRELNNCDKPSDRIFKQSFDKIKTTITVKDELKRPVSGMKVSIPSEKVEMQTNHLGQITASVSPIGYKKVIVSGDHHQMIDTNLYPFETRLDVVTRRNIPKDFVTFVLLTHPFENTYPNVYYKITNTADCSNYSGYTDEAGIGQVVLYLNEEYKMEVPELGYVSPVIKFVADKNKIFVTSDLPAKKEETTAKSKPDVMPTVSEQKLSDYLTIYYETTQWNISESMDRQMQYFIKELNKNPNARLEISSHTDCQGDPKTNLVLSRQRLAEVTKLFFSRGANEAQMIGRYFGEEKPINSCRCDGANNYNCSNEELRKNRRTEVRLIK
jgi:outer membrane protein OmpA-like peptidoglycan-associated protein/tetratricopeptide (TPR) repeat protein